MELTIDQPLDLGSSLESGQAHRWKKSDGWYSGVVRGEFIQIRQKGHILEFSSGPSPEATTAAMLRDYFRLTTIFMLSIRTSTGTAVWQRWSASTRA